MRRVRGKIALLLATAMVVTSIQIPVYGATEENVTVTEVAEEAVVENTEVTEEVTEDAPVGADSTIYVRSAADLVTALNDENLPTKEKIRIQMEAPLAGSDYLLTEELLGGKNLMIKEGADITLDLNDQNVTLSKNAAKYKIEVPKDTSFRIEGNYNYKVYHDEDNILYIGIVNRGILNMVGLGFFELSGDALVNEAGAVANLERVYIESSERDTVAVRNAGTMTIADGSNVIVSGESYVAIENTGEMQINGADVESIKDVVSGCGIKNIGVNAKLNIRGTTDIDNLSEAYGIFNDAGTVTISAYAEDLYDIAYISANKCAILTVNGGTVIGYEGMNVTGGVATTPFAGNEYYTGMTDGVFKMLGGTVDQITYSEDSLPILVGGTVGDVEDNRAQALKLMVGVNGEESDFSKYTYLTEEAGTPVAGTYVSDDVTKVAYAIVDGKVYQKKMQTEEPEELEEIWIEVANETELRNAVVSGGSIKLTGDISLLQNLLIAKDVVIDLRGSGLNQSTSDGAITVGEGVNARICDTSSGGAISFAKMKTGASAITNFGNLVFSSCDIEISTSYENVTDTKGITNHGNLQVTESTILSKVKGGTVLENDGTAEITRDVRIYGENHGITVIKNSGTCIMRNEPGVYGVGNSSYNNCTAVYNTGKFIMKDGRVTAVAPYIIGDGFNNYAIIYTDDHYPILQEGYVYGTGNENASAVSANNSVYGSAVVKDDGNGNYSRGYYQISESEPVSIIDGQNSERIINGVAKLQAYADAKDAYLLLQSGDVVKEIEDAFYIDSTDLAGEITYLITSANPEVASVTSSEEGGETTWTLTANKAGYTTLKSIVTLNGDMTVEDYLRVEVTDDKGALTAEDYEGSLLENQVAVNAYANADMTYEVPFEFHLDTSDMETATGASYLGAQEDSFEVSEIIIDDKEFNEYFEYELESPSWLPIHEGKNEKQCVFVLFNKTTNNGASTKLLDDQVKSIDQVEVKAKITNGVSGKDMVISLGYLDIHVQAVKPVIKANGSFALNGAYSADGYYYDVKRGQNIYPNRQSTVRLTDYVTATINGEQIVNSIPSISIKALSDGITSISSNGAITANVKKGRETVTAQVTFGYYVGAYQVKIPVTVTNKYPKVTLNKKTVTVSQKSSAETDIPLYLFAKDAASAGMVEDVEIVTAKGKSSNYTLRKTTLERASWNSTLKRYETNTFYLQPKSIVNKAETVTLKVTYKDTNAKAGKAYSTIVKVKVKPANKFTIKQNGKTSMSTTVGSEVYVNIKTTPEYFQGAKLVVTPLNGKTEIPEEVAGTTIDSNGEGTHLLKVTATEATKFRGKKLQFGVVWVDENGKTLTGKKVAKLTVSLFADNAKITSTTPSITVQPEKIYKKLVYYSDEQMGLKTFDAHNTTYVEYTAPVKFKGSGADAWDMTDYSDNVFDITYEAKKIILTANNKVIAGTQYIIPLEFINGRTREKQTVNLTVKVNDVKTVSAKFNIDTVTLYQEAPYVIQTLMTALGNAYVTNPAGGAGLTQITNVEIVDAESSPFELFQYIAIDKDDSTNTESNAKEVKYYGLTFKDKKYPSGVSAKALKTVTVKITYGNGIDDNYKTALVKLKVNVK